MLLRRKPIKVTIFDFSDLGYLKEMSFLINMNKYITTNINIMCKLYAFSIENEYVWFMLILYEYYVYV